MAQVMLLPKGIFGPTKKSKQWETIRKINSYKKMKLRESHLVPLSRQALAILQVLHPLTSNSQYIARSNKDL